MAHTKVIGGPPMGDVPRCYSEPACKHTPAKRRESRSPESGLVQDDSMIRDVWAHNLHEEFETIRHVVEKYNYIALDTEFPGEVARPNKPAFTGDYKYQLVKVNVDLLKVVQLGVAFCDEQGNTPEGISTWQFNFKFDLGSDTYAEDAIEFLRGSGLDFDRHQAEGVDVQDFGELLMSSGLVLNEEVKWVAFHGSYDFAYLLKLLTCQPLPDNEAAFQEAMRDFFPTVLDVKALLWLSNNAAAKDLSTFSLSRVAERFKVRRVGRSHQAGSDALVTAQAYFQMRQQVFGGNLDAYQNKCTIYGICGGPAEFIPSPQPSPGPSPAHHPSSRPGDSPAPTSSPAPSTPPGTRQLHLERAAVALTPGTGQRPAGLYRLSHSFDASTHTPSGSGNTSAKGNGAEAASSSSSSTLSLSLTDHSVDTNGQANGAPYHSSPQLMPHFQGQPGANADGSGNADFLARHHSHGHHMATVGLPSVSVQQMDGGKANPSLYHSPGNPYGSSPYPGQYLHPYMHHTGSNAMQQLHQATMHQRGGGNPFAYANANSQQHTPVHSYQDRQLSNGGTPVTLSAGDLQQSGQGGSGYGDALSYQQMHLRSPYGNASQYPSGSAPPYGLQQHHGLMQAARSVSPHGQDVSYGPYSTPQPHSAPHLLVNAGFRPRPRQLMEGLETPQQGMGQGMEGATLTPNNGAGGGNWVSSAAGNGSSNSSTSTVVGGQGGGSAQQSAGQAVNPGQFLLAQLKGQSTSSRSASVMLSEQTQGGANQGAAGSGGVSAGISVGQPADLLAMLQQGGKGGRQVAQEGAEALAVASS